MKQIFRRLLMCGFISVVAFAGSTGENTIGTKNGPLTIHPQEHATFVMEWNGKTIAVDPIGGADAFETFGRADLILITDVHGDHLSVDTVNALAGPSTVIV